MIEILKAVLFGIVEGITEWLPVSSTGHMILLDEFVRLKVSPEFFKTLAAVAGGGNGIALFFQIHLQQFCNIAVVFNDQYGYSHSKNLQNRVRFAFTSLYRKIWVLGE